MPEVLIAGYYGFGNTGDEAILASTVTALRRLAPELRLTVLSADPATTQKNHRVRALPRLDLARVAIAMSRSDLFLFGGGSLLQDTTSLRSLLYYLALLNMALAAKKPVMVYANGFGPVSSRMGRRACRWTLDRVDLITLRDEDSRRELESLGIARPPVRVTADPAFLLEAASPETVDNILVREGICRPQVGRLVVAVRYWNGLDPGALAGALDRLVQNTGLQVLFVPMHGEDDRRCSQETAALMSQPALVLKGSYAPSELLGLIGTAHVLLGMRFHALVFAVSQAVPAAGIVYDPKVSALLSTLGLPVAGHAGELDPVQLATTVEQLYRCREACRGQLVTLAGDLRRDAAVGVRQALDLLGATKEKGAP